MNPRASVIAAVGLVAGISLALALAAEQPALKRTPWTASHFAGSPEPPPPYAVELAFPKLKFAQPVVLSAAPGTERLFLAEVKGKIYSFPNDPSCERADLAFDLAQARPGATMLYGLTFHPEFHKNRFVYLCYVMGDGKPDGTRLARFEMSRTDPPRIDSASEKLLLTWRSGGHNAGCLAFGPDGYLYISTGDAAEPAPPDPFDTGQDLSDLLSSILRIDVDHEDPGKPYRVPADNPFVNLAGARPEIWAYGFRNPWRMSFDRQTGALWVGDVGWELWELVYRVERGGNYGWSIVEGRQPVRPEGKRGPTPIRPPVVDHPHSEAASVTGGYVYRGKRFADLLGAYIYGDFQSGRVWGVREENGKAVWHRELAATPLQLVAFGEDNAGEIYALDYERTGQIYRFVPNPEAKAQRAEFPRRLSQTGLFASTRDLEPMPGVLPYEINAEPWADGTTARRWLAIPGEKRIAVDREGRWTYPEGTVLAKTISAGACRLETQVLHLQQASWRPYTYIWNEDQTDAELAPAAGGSRKVTLADRAAPGGKRTIEHRISARTECLLCHNPWVEKKTTMFGTQSASPLAANALQLDRGENDDNPLHRFEQLGLFDRSQPASAGGLKPLVNPYDDRANLERRSRSYFQVNCAHCHQFGGGGSATILLSYDVPLAQMKALDVRPSQGTFGISNAKIIAPGDPDGSVLLYRMARLGNGHMPRLGASQVDERGLRLMRDWIAQLRPGGHAVTSGPAQDIKTMLESTRGALALLGLIDAGHLSEPARNEAISLGNASSKPEIRDLFERFIPESQRVKRLGDVIDPAAILRLRGDAERGRQLFFAEGAVQCKTCHRIDGNGQEVGPDLSKIGAKYPRPMLLEQILEPSRSIEPQYTLYLLETKSGQVHSGLLVERTAQAIVLRDASGPTIRVPADEVQELVPQAKSLMPELLLRDLTAQQVADLLEFLSGRQ